MDLGMDDDGLVTAETLAYDDSDGYDGLFISYVGIRNKKYILLFACGGYKRDRSSQSSLWKC
jgi:hypothetical protein